MNQLKIMSVMLAVFVSSTSAFAAADAAITADKNSVDSACTAEAQTAGCGSEVVGKGLLKCIHAYKKANRKTFQISPGCKTAMQTFHAEKKAGK
jgi:hypothetical protein